MFVHNAHWYCCLTLIFGSIVLVCVCVLWNDASKIYGEKRRTRQRRRRNIYKRNCKNYAHFLIDWHICIQTTNSPNECELTNWVFDVWAWVEASRLIRLVNSSMHTVVTKLTLTHSLQIRVYFIHKMNTHNEERKKNPIN